jgi:hypothetical protein
MHVHSKFEMIINLQLVSPMRTHKWQFTSRFRYHAFGWNSRLPIQRIKEALSEIKSFVRKDPHSCGRKRSKATGKIISSIGTGG